MDKNNHFGFHRETPDSGVGMSDFDLSKFLFDNSNPVDWDAIVPMDQEAQQPAMISPQQQQQQLTPTESSMATPTQTTNQHIDTTTTTPPESSILTTSATQSHPGPSSPKNNLPPLRLRTSYKQELHRMKALEDSRREQQQVKSSTHPPPQSTPVDLPTTLSCSPQAKVIPRDALQVKTRLENPTRYHLQQCMMEKATRYAMENGAQKGGGSVPPPATYTGCGFGVEQSSNQLRFVGLPPQPGSAPPNIFANNNNNNNVEPLLPSLVLPGPSLPPQSINSSLGTSVTSGCSTDLNDPIASLDVDATELNMLTLSEINELISQDDVDHCSYSTPSNNFMPSPQTPGATSGPHSTMQPSTPMQSPGTPQEGYVKASKDRQKKDNHNKIERRRRYLINDMINLQGLQLPKPNEPYYDKFGDVKQNKGAILQASVDYINLLKDENEEFRHKDVKTKQKLQETEQEKKKLLLRIQELEQICITNGVVIPEETLTWRSQPMEKISNLINGPIIKQEPKFPDLMDEGNLVTVGDPMLGPLDFDDVGMELS